MTYHSLFCCHLLYGSQLWGQSNITSQNKLQKLQNRALRKILFLKKQDSVSQTQKELKILKSPDVLYLQNCLFYVPDWNQSKIGKLFCWLKALRWQPHYLTKSKEKDLLDVPFVSTQIYGTQPVKYNRIKYWNNFRNNCSYITLHKCTYTLVQRQVKNYMIGKYRKCLLIPVE